MSDRAPDFVPALQTRRQYLLAEIRAIDGLLAVYDQPIGPLPKPPAPKLQPVVPASPKIPEVSAPKDPSDEFLLVWSPERDDVVRRDYPLGHSAAEIYARVCVLPGPRPSGPESINSRASRLGVRRPLPVASASGVAPKAAGAIPGEVVWSEERNAVLRADWPAGELTSKITDKVNALAGRKVTGANVACQAAYLKLKRPSGYMSRLASEQHQRTMATRQAAPDLPKVAASPSSMDSLPCPKAPASRSAEDALIARHIAEKGVTRCPPAAVAETTASIPDEYRAVMSAHAEEQMDSWIMKHGHRAQKDKLRRERAPQA